MASKAAFVVAALLLPALSAKAHADLLIYKIGTKGQKRQAGQGGSAGSPPTATASMGPGSGAGSGRVMVLYGKVSKDRTGISYNHPDVSEQLIFQPNQVEVEHVPTLRMEFNKIMNQAGKDPEAVMQAAAWALKKGLIVDFYVGIDKLLALDPSHERAHRIKELKKKFDESLPDTEDGAVEQTLRNLFKSPEMHIDTSDHFMLLHDTRLKAETGHRLNRAKERLRMLEQMYERFVLLFEIENVELDLPRQRLMAVLFKDHAEFHEFAQAMAPNSAGSAGFWNAERNVVGFYDDSTTEISDELKQERKQLEKAAEDAKKAGSSLERRRDSETLRQIKINEVLTDIDRWNCDVATVNREATHLLAANTGLLPRRVEIPEWVHEGLAAYFEAPRDGAWAGSGAVNESRLHDYEAMKDDVLHANINFIVADRIRGYASSRGATQQADAQIWALTHFLFEKHVHELVTFYGLLGVMPPDVKFNGDLLQDLFTRAFGPDRRSLLQEWHGYMRSLKSDVARMEAEGEQQSH